jgi:hypothetical protein
VEFRRCIGGVGFVGFPGSVEDLEMGAVFKTAKVRGGKLEVVARRQESRVVE